MWYFCWVIFANLGPFLISKIYWTNLKFEFSLNTYCKFYTFLDIYNLDYFCFCMGLFCNFVGWVLIYDTWSMEFMEESENQKVIRRYWTCCKLVWVHIWFPTYIWFYSIGFCKYLSMYIYLLCTELNIEQIRNFV